MILKYLVNVANIFPCFLWTIYESNGDLYTASDMNNKIKGFSKIEDYDSFIVNTPILDDVTDHRIGDDYVFAYAFSKDDILYGTYESMRIKIVERYKENKLHTDKLQMYFIFKYFGEINIAKKLIISCKKSKYPQINDLIKRETDSLDMADAIAMTLFTRNLKSFNELGVTGKTNYINKYGEDFVELVDNILKENINNKEWIKQAEIYREKYFNKQ